MPRFLARCVLLPSIVAALAAASVAVAEPPSGSLPGAVRLLESGRDVTAAEARHTVVWLETATAVESPEPTGQPLQMTTVRKQFLPRVLAAPVGSEVAFPNQDPILHNVFSVDRANRFDVGLYGSGESESTTFTSEGVVPVFCNVHHDMIGYVVVLDTPFYAAPGRDGSFRFDGVPPGPAKLTVWHERAKARTLNVTVPLIGSLTVDLEISKPRVPRHRNKFGKPYSRKRRGRAY
ncbi:MAG: carboxypeptidase regulatory-like domain-containing protein [Acidobacteriota bacterium]